MNTASKFIDKGFLKNLIPLRALSADRLDEILGKSRVENYPADCAILPALNQDKYVSYLLAGQIELTTTSSAQSIILNAKRHEAKYPIAHNLSGAYTAKTKTIASMLFIDAALFEILMEEYPSEEYEVTELNIGNDTADWMTKFLKSRIFLKLPTKNIQQLLINLEEITVHQGDSIVQQGAPGNYYYIIKQGRCAVSKRPVPKAEDIMIASLGPGDGFGEEALITDSLRSATVRMLEDGILMRLGKQDFVSLLVEPLITIVDYDRHVIKISHIIDVRLDNTNTEADLTNAVNIPFPILRLRLPTLDKTQSYLAYSDNKNEALAATFLLNQHGIDCQVLAIAPDQSIPLNPDFSSECMNRNNHTSAGVVSPDSDTNINSPVQQQKSKSNITPENITSLSNENKPKNKRVILKQDMLNEINRLRYEIKSLRKKTELEKGQQKEAFESQLAIIKAQTEAQAKKQETHDAELIRKALLKDKAIMLASLQSEIDAAKDKAVKQALVEAEHKAVEIRKSAHDEAIKIRLQEIKRHSNQVTQKNIPLTISHDNIINLSHTQTSKTQQQPPRPYAQEESLTLCLAEEIKEKLESIEKNNNGSEQLISIKKSDKKVKITSLGNRTKLEGDEDIFVFMYPEPEQAEEVRDTVNIQTDNKINVVKLDTYKPLPSSTDIEDKVSLNTALSHTKEIVLSDKDIKLTDVTPHKEGIAAAAMQGENSSTDKADRTKGIRFIAIALTLAIIALIYFLSSQDLKNYYQDFINFSKPKITNETSIRTPPTEPPPILHTSIFQLIEVYKWLEKRNTTHTMTDLRQQQ